MASSSSAIARWKLSHAQVSYNAACRPSLLCPFLLWKPAREQVSHKAACRPSPCCPPVPRRPRQPTQSVTRTRECRSWLTSRRGRQMARARHQARAVTAPLRLRHPMRRCRRRRQVRRCPFNRCRSSSKLCDVRCHLSRDVCRQQTLGSTCVHAALTGWCRPPQPTRRRCMAQPVRWLQPSRPPHPCRLPT